MLTLTIYSLSGIKASQLSRQQIFIILGSPTPARNSPTPSHYIQLMHLHLCALSSDFVRYISDSSTNRLLNLERDVWKRRGKMEGAEEKIDVRHTSVSWSPAELRRKGLLMKDIKNQSEDNVIAQRLLCQGSGDFKSQLCLISIVDTRLENRAIKLSLYNLVLEKLMFEVILKSLAFVHRYKHIQQITSNLKDIDELPETEFRFEKFTFMLFYYNQRLC